MLLVFGQLFLWIALLLAAVSAVTFFLGAARRDDLAARAGRDSLTGSLLALCGATAILVAALVRHDFTFLYVAQNSDLRLLPVYQVSALWAGAEGSLLLWTLLATVAAVMFTRNGADDRRGAVAGGVLATVLVMFLVVLNAASTPFSPTYPVPWDGEGLKLPLQTWAMIAHPPILFAGYALLAVPFALALANLVCARLAADLETVRKFLIGGWMFLTAGIALGAWWAYTDLGWGGYWAWDPVENASLIPWLLATAALHTLAVSQRQGRLLRTTLSLLVATFLACVLATYITRGGVVQSIHGYAAGGLASVYPIFIGLAALATVVLLVRRRPAAGNEKTGTVPIAVALAALLAAFAVAILSGTVGPQILSELTGRRYGLGIEDFNRIAAVFGVLILLTLGGHFVLRRLGKVARGGGGIRSAARVLAHLALVILIIAIAASQWLASDQTVSLTVGQTAEFDGRQVSLDDLTTDTTPDGRTVITRAVVSLQRGNEPAVVLKPARLASTVNDQARAEVAVHSGCWEDLYVSLNGTGPAEGQASLTLHRAAGMLWLWIGAGLLVVAGAVALFGRRTRTAIPTASFSLLPFTFLLFPFLVAAPPAPESPTPPKNITIEARVVVVTGSAGQTSPAPAGLPVEVLTMRAPDTLASYTGSTDAEGLARIAIPAPADGDEHPTAALVRVRFQGLSFHSDPFHLEAGLKAVKVPVRVYEATHDAAALKMSDHLIAIDFPRQGYLTVTEYVSAANDSNRVVVAADGAAPLFVDRPAEGAEDVTLLMTGGNAKWNPTGNRFEERGPLDPGVTALLYSYRLPIESLPYRLRKPIDAPTARTAVLLGSASLWAAGPLGPPRPDQPTQKSPPFMRYDVTQTVAAGGTLEVVIHAAPPPGEVPTWSFVALAVIASLGVALVAARRSDRRLTE